MTLFLKHYEYTPLRPDEFRLIRLMPASNLNDHIEAELIACPIKDPPPYTALSYTWGVGNSTVSIWVDRSQLRINANLDAALRSLRQNGSVTYLWADAICINQADFEERTHQVLEMAHIYSSATKVAVWLGEADESTALAQSFLRELGLMADMDEAVRGLRYEPKWHALEKLLSRSWFKRVWVLQEVAVARDIDVRCGHFSMSWRELDAGLSLLEKRSSLYPEMARLRDLHTRRLVFNVKMAFEGSNSTGLSLGTLVTKLAPLACTDPRDKIYALLGLANDSEKWISPDYSISVQSLYESFVKWTTSSSKSLDIILQRWAPHSAALGCPSWVPDFQENSFDLPIQLVNSSTELDYGRSVGSRRYNASGDPVSEITWRFADETRSLHATGFVVDVVERVTKPCLWEGLPEDWLELGMHDTNSHKGNFWRVLLADRDPIGIGSPPDDYGELFEPILSRTKGLGVGQQVELTNTMRERSSSSKLATHFLYASMHSVIFSRALARVQSLGSLALVPGNTRVGDVVCILYGCSVPVILRRSLRGFQLVGESYVHGIMDGEAKGGPGRDEIIVIEPTRVDPVKFGAPALGASQIPLNRHTALISTEEVITETGPARHLLDTPSSPTAMTAFPASTWHQYRVIWTSPGGYRGADLLTELRPGSVREYTELLREEGVVLTLEEVGIADPALEGLKALALLTSITLSNTVTSFKATISSLFRRPSLTTSTGIPMSVGSSQPKNQAVAQLAQRQGNVPIRDDFLLLCINDSRYLITRKDLNVARIVSDQQLFATIRQEYMSRRGHLLHILSIKSVQRITFVRFALRENNEVDCLQPDNLPPLTASHYELDPWPPGRIPPIGNMYLMRRFTTPNECRDSSFCLKQFPKRIERQPQLGIPPDLDTGWGLHFQEGYDAEKIAAAALAGFLISIAFGIVWAIRHSVADGFQVAGWVVSSWALGIATLQFVVNRL